MMRPRTRMTVFGSTVLVVLLLCAGFALAFTDVSPGDDYSQAIDELSRLNIINGFQDNTFGPQKLVTRQQFAKMIVLTLGLPVSDNDICPFGDVDKSGPGNLYPDNYVAVAAARGITKGVTANAFAPGRNITRAQVITMVVRAAPSMGITLSQPTSAYYGDSRYVMRNFDDATHGRNAQIAEVSGLLFGIRLDSAGVWDPFKNATRGEVAQILWRLRQKMAPITTSPPTTQPPDYGLLAYDDFSDPNNGLFVEATYDNSRLRYLGGNYRIDVSAPKITTMGWAGTVYTDVSVAADANPSLRTGSFEYGLVFRLQDMQNLYQLSVQDNTATIWKRVGGEWTDLSGPVDLPPAASDGWRHLDVIMLGDTLIGYVDDVSIGPVHDSTFSQGKVGFFVGTFDTANVYVRYDEFAVWSVIVY